jgi:hypothetical protein
VSPPAARRPPWQTPGWLGEVLEVVDAELSTLDLRRTDVPTRIRHSNLTSVLRIPTDRFTVWLKAVPSMFAHEAEVIDWLGVIAPASVPKVLAKTAEWWLGREFPERAVNCPMPTSESTIVDWAADVAPALPTSRVSDQKATRKDHFLATLAKLQLASLDRVGELQALGCPDRPLERLVDDVAQLIVRPDLVGPELRSDLSDTLPKLDRLCDAIASMRFPPALVHGDVHPGNLLWTESGWFLYDWTDACISHPFVDLALPLVYGSADERAIGVRCFAAEWSNVVGEDAVETALRASPALGTAHQAVSCVKVVDGLGATSLDQGDLAQGLVDYLRFWVRSLLVSLRRYEQEPRSSLKRIEDRSKGCWPRRLSVREPTRPRGPGRVLPDKSAKMRVSRHKPKPRNPAVAGFFYAPERISTSTR